MPPAPARAQQPAGGGMRLFLAAVTATAAVAGVAARPVGNAAGVQSSSPPALPPKVDYSGLSEAEQRALFDQYCCDFGKQYGCGGADDGGGVVAGDFVEARFAAFQQSLERISALNRRPGGTAVYGLNALSDLTPAEFQERYLMKRRGGGREVTYRHGGGAVEQEVAATEAAAVAAAGVGVAAGASYYNTSITDDCDWRIPTSCGSAVKTAVTPVVNQNACGGCYAYSAVATLESAFALAGFNVTKLSVSQILDCDHGEYGCQGGDATYALDFLRGAGSWTAADYPDTAAAAGKTSPCPAPSQQPQPAVYFNLTKLGVPFASGTGYSQGKYVDVVAKAVREHGPVAACMNAQWGWHDYAGGVISDVQLCSPFWDSVDHCVNIVGYRASAAAIASMGMPYWVVKNSWGSNWGHQGYLYISMETNVCGVLNEIVYADNVRAGPGYTESR